MMVPSYRTRIVSNGRNIKIFQAHAPWAPHHCTHPDTNHVSDRVLRQRLLLEEYGAEIEYIKGDKNVVADALSRLPTQELFLFDDTGDAEFPLNLRLIADHQHSDDYLQTQLRANSKKFIIIVRE